MGLRESLLSWSRRWVPVLKFKDGVTLFCGVVDCGSGGLQFPWVTVSMNLRFRVKNTASLSRALPKVECEMAQDSGCSSQCGGQSVSTTSHHQNSRMTFIHADHVPRHFPSFSCIRSPPYRSVHLTCGRLSVPSPGRHWWA